MLGAFALGILLVIGWAVLVTEAADLADRFRRARCHWEETLPVTIAGNRFVIAATPRVMLHAGDRWIGGEEVSGYRQREQRFGFCLNGLPQGPLPVQAITVGFDTARGFATRAGLPEVEGPLIEIGAPELFLPDAPPPLGRSTELLVYHRNEDFGWPRMVTEGIGRDGFRIGATCRNASMSEWLCDVSVHDTRANLSYRFERLVVEAAGFHGRPMPTAFSNVARGMRALGEMLKADAVAVQ
ncbi:MAG: hypothetical protein CSA74_02485 [Rhodobacterales bacterium]|nr:MAG: hypothetical protein CSA74_02485 [Rhodobacterales bacterium]